MKVISVWQPWASLIVHGMKFFETRGYPPPKSVLGQTIGIASTKNITPDQRSAYADPEFERFFKQSGLPELEELPRGVLLGTVTVDSFELVTEDFLEDVTREELSFGWYDLGRYAWRLRYPKPLVTPIPIQGKQGIYDWRGFDVGSSAAQAETGMQGREGQGRPDGQADLRSHLHPVV